MNYKATCVCQASIELHDDIIVYDSPDTTQKKRERFDARVEKWETQHAPCLGAWRKRVEGTK